MERLLVAAALALALFFLATALVAIANFAWRQPMFDQFRVYENFINLPFPSSLWQLDNGHRPILPALIRVADIHLFGSRQLLQIIFGSGCALATALTIALCAWRDPAAPAATRAGGVLAAVVAVFWLANARELMHSHEMVQAYASTLSVTLAALCTWRAQGGAARRWMLLATLACVAATFSFGSGIASFVAVLLTGLLLRLPRSVLLLPAAALAACLALYVFMLPGDGSVREVLAFRPLDSLLTSARWLASPWVNGWLGVGHDPLHAWVGEYMQQSRPGRVLAQSADLANALPGADWRTTTSACIGLLGLAALAWAVIARLRWSQPTRLEVIALCLGLFTAASAGIIGLSRLNYLQLHPDQLFADRYLVWPCLFWLSLVLLALARLHRLARGRIGAVAAVVVLALPLLVTHRMYAGWAASVYRKTEQLAAAARSGVVDLSLYPVAADADAATVGRTLALLRERRLAMFGGGWQAVGETWSGSLDAAAPLQAQLLQQAPVADAASARPALHFSGVLAAATPRPAGTRLLVLDAASRVHGYAQISFIAPHKSSLRLDLPAKRGFDGYIAGYDANQAYRLVAADFGSGRAWPVLEIPAAAAAPAIPAAPSPLATTPLPQIPAAPPKL
ncbi:hypothetical protein [Tahibacter harae]|uniref:4-amino-4-deoxy-L-arabinose transferase-like glycosyltransferase n=1 Tax=Tahibacter harae TaxID=2963937 RepID=A0ABT1QR60_9GAMM|nr:hypothetical protein [Tahibacter harae]MCQ4164782.1 hypothetical protein [Tahibacter harae]